MTEKELREAWEKYQNTSHPEDRMSYVEFLSEQGIQLENNWFGDEDEWYK